MQEIEIYNRRLGRLATQMGVAVDGEDEEPEVDLSGLPPYEKSRIECTMLMSRVREDTAMLDELDSTKTAQRAQLSTRIRKNLRDLKTRSEGLKKEATRAGRQDDYLELTKHVKRTEAMYRQRFRTDQSSREDLPLGGDGDGGGYGTASSVRRLDEIRDKSYGGGGYGASEELLDPMQDEEFQQYMQRTLENDAALDKGLLQLHQGLLRVKQHAEVFSSELQTQNMYLDRINDKADNMVQEMEGLNTRLKRTLKEVDRDKYCCYMICLILLLGIIGVIVTQTGVFK